jgi:phosphomannomutase
MAVSLFMGRAEYTYDMNIDQSIFKAYDIRGVYPNQIDENIAYALGRAYATFILQAWTEERMPLIAVGSDMRTSSPSLKAEIVRGLRESGVHVVTIGLASTPTFYFAVARYGYDGGLQISASHNPKEYNGLKIVRAGGVPVSKDTGIFAIRDIVVSESFTAKAAALGDLSQVEGVVSAEAIEQTADMDLEAIKPFRIVIDGSNGMGSVDMDALFKHIPQCELVKMNFELDGTFPAHGADPMQEKNTVSLRAKILETGASLGIAPDGDGDRIFFFDETGAVLPQAILRGMMAQIAIAEHPGATVCYDIRPGRITKDMIEAVGGTAVVTPVGHSLIKESMIKHGAVFGGESSGHYFYKLPYGTFEAPIVLAAKFLLHLSISGQTLSELAAPYKIYANSGEINTIVPNREAVDAAIAMLQKRYADGAQNELDGLTVEYPEWWFNVRGSNTEPLLRLTVEAIDAGIMAKKRDEILSQING